MIDNIRGKVLDIIQNKNYVTEITRETKFKESGIYMIYIDNFNDENTVPIYIGQTNNFQRRYQEHFSEILSLNRLKYNYYCELIDNQFYDGRYKACKIFKYMVDNGCTLKDFRMIALELVDGELLVEKEHEYLSLLMPSFCGFNQLNSRLSAIRMYHEGKNKFTALEYLEFCKTVTDDIDGFRRFKNHGFTDFNLRLAMLSRMPFANQECIMDFEKIEPQVTAINIELRELEEEYLSKEEIKSLDTEREETKKRSEIFKIKEGLALRKTRYIRKEIKKLFDKFKIRSKVAYEDFRGSIEEYLEEDRQRLTKKFENYLEKRKIKLEFQTDFKSMSEKISKLDREIESIEINYTDQREKVKEMKGQRISRTTSFLKPSRKYNSFPLEDMYQQCVFDKEVKENICEINISFSNNGRNKDVEIIKIDYRIFKENNFIERKDIFIESDANKFFEVQHINHIEKDYNNPFVWRKSTFKIVVANKHYDPIRSGDIDFIDTFISVNAEYRTGVNEFTVKDKVLRPLNDVLKEIVQSIDSSTKIIPCISESANCMNSSLKDSWSYRLEEEIYNSHLVKALLRYKKR